MWHKSPIDGSTYTLVNKVNKHLTLKYCTWMKMFVRVKHLSLSMYNKKVV